MYPNKDGWLSVETVGAKGERRTVFHGLLEVSSAEDRERSKQRILDAVRAHRSLQESEMPPYKLVSLYSGKVTVSLPSKEGNTMSGESLGRSALMQFACFSLLR
eukprot:gb/GFBE01054973.1/.p1 GENE.gb/GFBE01054973.1/~~gb/GFBE01054973.1/.p1  ORF type:complete len:104 (+),score=18.69 gb/GFBE01054973.1/:1-312(+)